MHETYDKLIALLDANKASYRLIEHVPEGQTDKVSALRGHPVEAAAKCIVKIGKKASRFVLAVIPGDARVDRARSSRCFPAPHMQVLRQRTSPSASLEA